MSDSPGLLGSARSKAVPLVRETLKGASAAVDLVRRPVDGITILIYHRVGAGNGGQMDLSPSDFRQQLDWLTRNRRVISLDQAADELAAAGHTAAGHPATGHPATTAVEPGVVLTFDDGTTDWVDHVLPAITEFEVPSTFYVATSFVDEGLAFPLDGRPATWGALAELASSELVTIGSHTHRHMLLDRLEPAAVDDELDRSIELIGEHLGVAARHFAYPKAVAGSTVAEAAVRRRFRTAVLAGTRANDIGVDLHRLNRSPIQGSDSQRWFRRKAVGGMGFEDDLRQRLNRLRYRGRTT